MTVWKTKYGTRRVRRDPPTLEEAIFAAQGMTDDLQQQVEIAASLMDMPLDEVKKAVIKTGAVRRQTSTIAFTEREGTVRSFVVERKKVRRPAQPTAH
jgi:hypothetical protein